MGTGLCSEELTDDFCSALHAISEFRNAPVCMCVFPVPQENVWLGEFAVWTEFTYYSISKSALCKGENILLILQSFISMIVAVVTDNFLKILHQPAF